MLYLQNGIFREGRSPVTVTASDGYGNASGSFNSSYSFSSVALSYEGTHTYEFRLTYMNEAILVDEINGEMIINGLSSRSVTLFGSYITLNKIPSYIDGVKNGLEDNALLLNVNDQNSHYYSYLMSLQSVTVGELMFTIVTPKRMTDIDISSWRAVYMAGYDVFEDGALVASATSNGGTGTDLGFTVEYDWSGRVLLSDVNDDNTGLPAFPGYGDFPDVGMAAHSILSNGDTTYATSYQDPYGPANMFGNVSACNWESAILAGRNPGGYSSTFGYKFQNGSQRVNTIVVAQAGARFAGTVTVQWYDTSSQTWEYVSTHPSVTAFGTSDRVCGRSHSMS
jgi:hypothetical protein